jgi:hypothetical protein
MPLHPAWVKNISRRVLWAALETDISKDDRRAMSAFFEDRCAYCENALGSRWHADHLLAVDLGGFNHLSNRVPSCPRCNEHEKRDMEWTKFLEVKSSGEGTILARRRERIDNWVRLKKPTAFPVTEAERQAWKREVEALAEAIDASWQRLKKLRSSGRSIG